MAKMYTYPHWETNVIDKSIYTPLVREQLPLFLPIFFMRTQQGPVGVPQYVNRYTEAVNIFGEGTFDDRTQYYSREALYLNQLFARQGAFITRMASSDAQYGSLVLELRVRNKSVKQYERDADGQYIVDELGARIPRIDNGAEVFEDGVELKWTVRPLDLTKETIKNLKVTTVREGSSGESKIYPILAMKATSVGAYANDMGIKFFVDLNEMDDTLANNVGAIPYTFGAVKKTYGQDTVSPVLSSWSNQFETFVCKPDSNDARVDRNIYFDDIINNYYEKKLPYDMHLYAANIEAVGKIIQDVEFADDTLTDPYLVNLCEPFNIEDVPMPHVVFSDDDDSISLNDTRILYMQGGNDGTIDDDAIETLTRQYLKDNIYPELFEQPRYPFTHIIDTGVSIDTKKAFIQFMGKHDAHKVILSTQWANMNRMNTKAEDYSINYTCGFVA